MLTKENNIIVSFKSSAEVERDCKLWAAEIELDYKPDLIVFIAKSGFLFAKPLAEHFGCSIVDVIASREDNKVKDYLKSIIPWMPRCLLAFLLKRRVSKPNYHKKSNRIVKGTIRFDKIGLDKYDKILLVDDSVDTGWSLLKVQEYLNVNGAYGKYKTASYCVLSESENRIKVDFCRYKDQIVITSTSRYSSEYQKFLDEYIGWKNESDTTFEV
ncbi:MAG: phosphoribosyltransferase [Butyrivibrio sp.]|nr:phosphoribosyltransferase [Butyrivibrio sp.]